MLSSPRKKGCDGSGELQTFPDASWSAWLQCLAICKTAKLTRSLFRRPSLHKSLAARTSPKRALRQALGIRTPRGWGWLTNPKRAAYNRVYDRSSVSWWSLLRKLFR
jgi:hypothetical protein